MYNINPKLVAGIGLKLSDTKTVRLEAYRIIGMPGRYHLNFITKDKDLGNARKPVWFGERPEHYCSEKLYDFVYKLPFQTRKRFIRFLHETARRELN